MKSNNDYGLLSYIPSTFLDGPYKRLWRKSAMHQAEDTMKEDNQVFKLEDGQVVFAGTDTVQVILTQVQVSAVVFVVRKMMGEQHDSKSK